MNSPPVSSDRKIFFQAALLAIGGLAFPTLSSGAESWNFDTGTQGWTLYDAVGSGNYSSMGSGTLNWNATGGNPGGFVSAADPSNGSFMFRAPISGVNYSAFNGGHLLLSLQTDLFPDFSEDSVVVFRGGAGNFTIVSALGRQPASSWTDYSLSLNASAFHLDNLSGGIVTSDQFRDVLSNLQLFLIDGEFHSGIAETTGLDSVAFVAPAGTNVPDSPDCGLAGVTLLSMIAWARRDGRHRSAAS